MHADEATKLVRHELARALLKHPKGFNSQHEGYAVILEEIRELEKEVFWGEKEHAKEEAIQIAAMAIRFLMDLHADG